MLFRSVSQSRYHTPFADGVFKIRDENGVKEVVLEHETYESIYTAYDFKQDSIVLEFNFLEAVATLFHENPKKVLIIGVCGGALPLYLSKMYPDMDITGVDIDPTSEEIARHEFGLPNNIELVTADGYEYLKQSEESYDLIFVDINIVEDYPEQFLSEEWAYIVQTRLNPNGLAIIHQDYVFYQTKSFTEGVQDSSFGGDVQTAFIHKFQNYTGAFEYHGWLSYPEPFTLVGVYSNDRPLNRRELINKAIQRSKGKSVSKKYFKRLVNFAGMFVNSISDI